MRLVYPVVTFAGAASGDLSASFASDPIQLDNVDQLAIQAVFTGTAPTGTFKLQASCDVGQHGASGPASSTGVTNWSDVPSSSKAITAAGDALWLLADVAFPWVRIVWTFTSGTGAFTAKASGRGGGK